MSINGILLEEKGTVTCAGGISTLGGKCCLCAILGNNFPGNGQPNFRTIKNITHPTSSLQIPATKMFKQFARLLKNAMQCITISDSAKVQYPLFKLPDFPKTYEEYLAGKEKTKGKCQEEEQPSTLTLQVQGRRRYGTFSITPSLEAFLDYRSASVIDLSPNPYEEEFAGLAELLGEPEDTPYTVAEFFAYHEGNLEYLLEPFIEDEEVYGPYSLLIDWES